MYGGGGRRGGREGGRGGGARGAGGFAGGPVGRGGRGRGGGRVAGDGGGRGGGRIAAGARPVEEGMRINIKQLLEDFQASDEQGAQAPTPTTRPKGVLLYALSGLWHCIAVRIDVDGHAASSTRRTRRAAISRALGLRGMQRWPSRLISTTTTAPWCIPSAGSTVSPPRATGARSHPLGCTTGLSHNTENPST
jgi:hypothetical protein